jgi:hypothetical protein
MLVCVIGLAGMATAMLALGLSHSKEQRGERQEIHAGYVCQAGLSQAMYQLRRGLSGAVGTQANPTPWGSSKFWVDAQPVTVDITRLRATGKDDKTGASEELVVRAVPNTIWRFGLFGKEDLHMDSNARVDSYDSTAGNYTSQAVNGPNSDPYARQNGPVGSNSDVSLDQNARVHGNATPGPNHSATVTGNAYVSGSTAPASTQVEMPDIQVPTYTNYGPLLNAQGVVPAGNRAYTTMTIKQNKTLTFTGPSNIVISSLTLNSNSIISVDATNGPVTFYVIDNFIMNSNSSIAPTSGKPADVRINLLSDNVASPEIQVQLDTVDFNSNSSITGIMMAPNARITFDSNFTLYGSLMARSIDVNSNAVFHFDEDLLHSTANGVPTYETLSWREIPYQH